MKIDAITLEHTIRNACSTYGIKNIMYAGIVGSAVVTKRRTDIDVVVLFKDALIETPYLVHVGTVSLLFLNGDWLTYEKHAERPTGLVPSILFKSIMLSRPIIGNKDEIDLPKIMVSPADWINIEIKKRRYKKTDRKNYIVALLFERLLNVSPDLSVYSFDNVEMAKSIGIPKLACELTLIYKVRRTKKSFASCSLSSLSKNEFRKNR